MNGDKDKTGPEATEALEITQETTIEKTSESADTKKTGEKSTPELPPRKAKRWRLRAIIFAVLLLSILLIIGSGYYGWQYWQTFSSQQEKRLQALEAQANTQNARLDTLSAKQVARINKQRSLLEALKSDQQLQQQQLDSHTQRLRALAGTSRDDWLLAEARYLLRLASQRLLVESSTESAQRLLSSADDILQSVDDSGVLPVRGAIAKELIALKLAKTVDRQGIYLQISALKSQIQQLPLTPFRPERDQDSTSTDHKTQDNTNDNTKPVSAWSSFKEVLSTLSQFVKVRQYDEAPDLLVSEQQQLRVLNNIWFAFEQAQFALLHEQPDIYRDSLKQAIHLWNLYYAHYIEHEVVHSELKKLRALNIIQRIPSISQSSELLTDYIERFHRLKPSDSTEDEPQAVPAEESSK